MPDPFETANNAVVLESALRIELAGTVANLPTAAPTIGTDGYSLASAARCVVAVAGGTAMTATVWFYVGSTWYMANAAALTVDVAGGVVERLNCAGFTRVYVQGSAESSGTLSVYRSIL
jgi:hypothetical protein